MWEEEEGLRQKVVRMVELEALSGHAMRKGIIDEPPQRLVREIDAFLERVEILLRLWILVGERTDGVSVAVHEDLDRWLDLCHCVRVLGVLQGQDLVLKVPLLLQVIDGHPFARLSASCTRALL